MKISKVQNKPIDGCLDSIVDNLKELSTIVDNLDSAIKKEEIENPAIVSRIEIIKSKILTVIESLETIT